MVVEKLTSDNNIKRFTVQMDSNLYTSIKALAPHLGGQAGRVVSTYELLNKLVVLGITEYAKNKTKHKININKPEFKQARKLAKDCP